MYVCAYGWIGRQYEVRIAPVGLSKSVKRLVQARIPDLSQMQDIADYVMKYATRTIIDFAVASAATAAASLDRREPADIGVFVCVCGG